MAYGGSVPVGACDIDARKLKINKIIALGTSGYVYRGVYNNKKVAVKVFHIASGPKRSSPKSFMQEVSLSKDLYHPNIIKFIGVMKNMAEVNMKVKNNQDFDPSQDCCVVTEFLSQGTLFRYLQKHQEKKLPISIVIHLALDIANGLSYLHSKKIMHRDVKTENMLLDEHGRVKIIDFEISGVEHVIEHNPSTGTLGYMAPEVHAGEPYDHKCDVYSFGICLWEIYCCSLPYDMENIYETIKDNPIFYTNLRPVILNSTPSVLADLMRQCWHANPKKRPEMSSVVQILMDFEESTLKQGFKGLRHFSCF